MSILATKSRVIPMTRNGCGQRRPGRLEREKDPLQISRGNRIGIAGLAMQAHLIVAIIFFVALSNEIDNRLGLLEPPVAGAPDPAVAAPSRLITASPAIVRVTGVETALVSTTKRRGQQTKMAAPSSDSNVKQGK